MKKIKDFIIGILLGSGAILPGISSGVLCVIFGIYDKLAQIFGGGLFVPISGFANALASSAMECRSEGFIFGIGSNMFKLAGSVIIYGIVSALIFSTLRYGWMLL